MIDILLGGLWGWDGYVTSRGMLGLQAQLQVSGFEVEAFTWDNYKQANAPIVIGYSGGGSRATWLKFPIELMILYDPSPSWQMEPIGTNVKKVICYQNTSPMMLGLGGGVAIGPQVETIMVSEQHLLIQYDQSLHNRTLHAIAAMERGHV